MHRVTARFAALMATRSNRRRLGEDPVSFKSRHILDTLFSDAGMPRSTLKLRRRASSQRSWPRRRRHWAPSATVQIAAHGPTLTVDPLYLADHRPDGALGGRTRANRINILQTGRRPNSKVYSKVERCTSMMRLREQLMARPKSPADFVQENGFGSALAASIEQFRKRVLRTAFDNEDDPRPQWRRLRRSPMLGIWTSTMRSEAICLASEKRARASLRAASPSLLRSRPFGFVNRKMFSFRSNPASIMA